MSSSGHCSCGIGFLSCCLGCLIISCGFGFQLWPRVSQLWPWVYLSTLNVLRHQRRFQSTFNYKYGFSEEWKTGRPWLLTSTNEDEHRHITVTVNCEFDADANFELYNTV